MITNPLTPTVSSAIFVKSLTDGFNGIGHRLATALVKGVPADESRGIPALSASDISGAIAALSEADQASLHSLLAILAPAPTPTPSS